MDDLISRQAAIDRISKQREHLQPDIYPQDKIGDAAYRVCAEFIGRLPSAQPRPKGRWISMSDIDGDYYCCSQCGGELPRYSLSTPTWDDPYTYLQSIDETNFCPNCGADMRGAEDD